MISSVLEDSLFTGDRFRDDAAQVLASHIQEFHSYPSYEAKIKYLARLLNLNLAEGWMGGKSAEHSADSFQQILIVLDFYYYGLQFAKECQFSSDQAAVFFHLMKQTHEHCCHESALIRLEKDYDHFKNVLLNKCLYRPPRSEKIFEFHQVKQIHDYLLNTYFRHYTMYKYCLTSRPVLTLMAVPDNYDPLKNQLPNPLNQLLNPSGLAGNAPEHEKNVFANNQNEDTQSQQLPEQEQTANELSDKTKEPEVESQAIQDMQRLISELLEPKMESLVTQIMSKMQNQEDNISKVIVNAAPTTK